MRPEHAPADVGTVTVASPLGPIAVTADRSAVTRLEFVRDASTTEPAAESLTLDGVLARAVLQLRRYFEGDLREFDLPVAPRGTEFQLRVWQALRGIPFGEAVSYAEIARRIGQPTASRAVGAANGRNPIAIVIPCHRVIGANGTLTGYAGGLDIKAWLLRHESEGRVELPEVSGFLGRQTLPGLCLG